MEIAVLGAGCTKCKTLYEQVKKVVEETKTVATLKKVEDITEIVQYGVMATPAVVINGTIVSQGKIPKDSEIEDWLSKKGEN